jgi:hypothetical protein
MTATGTAVFTNPDDYRTGVGDACVDLVLTGPGDFKARLTWLKLHHLHVFRGREDVPSIAYISLVPLRTFVSFALPSASPQVWNGVELQPGDLILHSRGEHGHRWTKGASQWALVSLPPNQLAHYYTAMVELDLTDQRLLESSDHSLARRCGCGACSPRLATSQRQSPKPFLTLKPRERSSRSSFTRSSIVLRLTMRTAVRRHDSVRRTS